jgi:hypothetical protein
MSWDYTRYKATCKQCGATGVCTQGSDDWMRSSTSWEGFTEVAPSAYEVGRKRADARDMGARCACGSTNVEVGEVLQD